MALTFETVRENQNKLNQFIERWKNEIARNRLFLNFRQDQAELVRQLSTLGSSSQWFAHQNRLEQFRLHIEFYVRCLKNTNLTPTKRHEYQGMLYLFLVRVPEALNSSLTYIENNRSFANNRVLREATLLTVLQFQHLLDSTLDILMPRREKVFPLQLAGLRVDYEKAYVFKHGRGLFGFFKLPIKRYFRQDSREEELNFLEDIDFFLQGEGAVLSTENKEKLKLSALNLVRFKIRMEEHGNGSQLKRIIETQLKEVGLFNNQEIITDFLDLCERINIAVPPGLEACFREDLRVLAYN